MKFGLNFFPSFRASDSSTAEYFAQCLRLAERADQLGFHSVKTVEHYFYDYGGHSPNPVVFLAAVAARTQRIRPITGAVIPAFNHPIKLAAELAALDNLSNGRLDVGFGRAFIPKEFEVFGVSMDESRARFEEGIDIVTRLWTEDRVSYDGKLVESIGRTTLDSMLADHQALIGTPDEVIEQLQYHIDVFGEFEPSMQINFGGIGDREAFRTLELFAGHVMPKLA